MFILFFLLIILIIISLCKPKESFYAMNGPAKHTYIKCCRKNGCKSTKCKNMLRSYSKKLEYVGKLSTIDNIGKKKKLYVYKKYNSKKNKNIFYIRVLIKGTNNYLYKILRTDNDVLTGDIFNLYDRKFRAYIPKVTYFNPLYRNLNYMYELGKRYFPISFYANKYNYISPIDMNKPDYLVNYRKTY